MEDAALHVNLEGLSQLCDIPSFLVVLPTRGIRQTVCAKNPGPLHKDCSRDWWLSKPYTSCEFYNEPLELNFRNPIPKLQGLYKPVLSCHPAVVGASHWHCRVQLAWFVVSDSAGATASTVVDSAWLTTFVALGSRISVTGKSLCFIQKVALCCHGCKFKYVDLLSVGDCPPNLRLYKWCYWVNSSSLQSILLQSAYTALKALKYWSMGLLNVRPGTAVLIWSSITWYMAFQTTVRIPPRALTVAARERFSTDSSTMYNTVHTRLRLRTFLHRRSRRVVGERMSHYHLLGRVQVPLDAPQLLDSLDLSHFPCQGFESLPRLL